MAWRESMLAWEVERDSLADHLIHNDALRSVLKGAGSFEQTTSKPVVNFKRRVAKLATDLEITPTEALTMIITRATDHVEGADG